jgi:hypothetical protein
MRRRTIRPASRQTLVLITLILAAIFWVCWEVGRLLSRVSWLQLLVLSASTSVFGLMLAGWIFQES